MPIRSRHTRDRKGWKGRKVEKGREREERDGKGGRLKGRKVEKYILILSLN